MATTQTPQSVTAFSTLPSPREQFLQAYEKEHATTMRVLRAFPEDQLDFRPHERCKTARELGWMFVLERALGGMVWNDAFANGVPAGNPPPPPDSWREILTALEKSHRDFRTLIETASDEKLMETVKFLVAPKTLGDYTRLQFAWFLLCDEIHHRGQFSVYLRMAGGKVPSIYGPSGDEPWT